MELQVSPTGQVRCLNDEAIDLGQLGALSITRSAHVAPAADGYWRADMAPVGGPVLGPFPHRSEALAAER